MFSLKKFYPTPRPIIFMMVIFITMFTTFTVDISLNIIGYLEELEIVEGEILSIEERMFTEKEWKNQYVGSHSSESFSNLVNKSLYPFVFKGCFLKVKK